MSTLQRMQLLGAWLVLVALGILLAIMPQLRVVDRIIAQEAAFSEAARRNANGPDKLTQLAAKLSEIRATAEQMTKPIPGRSDVAGLIRDLTAELDRHGMSGHEIATGAADEIGGVHSIPVTIHLTGTFLGIYESIGWLEAMPRLIRILRMTIENPDRSSSDQLTSLNTSVKAELIINVYFDPAELDGEFSMAAIAGDPP